MNLQKEEVKAYLALCKQAMHPAISIPLNIVGIVGGTALGEKIFGTGAEVERLKQQQKGMAQYIRQMEQKQQQSGQWPNIANKYTLGGGALGAGLGALVGPSVFGRRSPGTSRLLGGLTGGIGGALMGHYLKSRQSAK